MTDEMTVEKLMSVINDLVEALEEIAGQDYRGNRPKASSIAFRALVKAKPFIEGVKP